MTDTFEGMSTPKSGAADFCVSVTPNDSTDLATFARGLSCAVSGNIALHDMAGNTTTIYVAAGGIFPQRARRVLSAGTTATGIVAHW